MRSLGFRGLRFPKDAFGALGAVGHGGERLASLRAAVRGHSAAEAALELLASRALIAIATSAANRPTHPLSFHPPIDLRLDGLLDHHAAHLADRGAALPLLRRVQHRRMTIQIPTNLFTDLTPLARATQGETPRHPPGPLTHQPLPGSWNHPSEVHQTATPTGQTHPPVPRRAIRPRGRQLAGRPHPLHRPTNVGTPVQ